MFRSKSLLIIVTVFTVLIPDVLLAINTENLNTNSPSDLAKSLVGDGITISNVVFTGAKEAAGFFTNAVGDGFSISSGIILSSGDIANAIGPNNNDGITTDNEQEGDKDLAELVGTETFDAAVLEFDFVAEKEFFSFLYAFASDEYNEFVGSSFNDVFAFFLDGKNIALIPFSDQDVTINNLNYENNSYFFNDNDAFDGGVEGGGATPVPYNTQFDGFTNILWAQGIVKPGDTYHIKLAIADVSDSILDSAVLIASGSFSSAIPTMSFSHDSHDFGCVILDEIISETFTITNDGEGDLMVGNIAIGGVNKEDFSIKNNGCPIGVLKPLETCSFDLNISPTTSPGFKNANIEIISNDFDTPLITVKLAANVTSPRPIINIVNNDSGAGTVTSNPSGMNCNGDCAKSFDACSMVTLTATPDDGSLFEGWQGPGCSGTGTCTVKMIKDITLYPNFTPVLVPDGLVAYYPFIGNARDESGKGNDGVEFGATLAKDRFGNTNRAYLFDGQNDYLEIDNSPDFTFGQNLSFVAWIYPMDSKSGPIISQWVEGREDKTIEFNQNNSVTLHLKDALNAETGSSAETVPLNKWTQVAGIYNGANAEIYINGNLITATDARGSLANYGGKIYFGFNPAKSITGFQGKIDDIRIYNRALSAAEIGYLYEKEKATPNVYCAGTPYELAYALMQAERDEADDIIRIVQGNYTGIFNYHGGDDSSLTLKGGYNADCTIQTVYSANTILSSNGMWNVLELISSNKTDFTVDGLTLTNGAVPEDSHSNVLVLDAPNSKKTNGGGLYIDTVGGNVNLTDNVINDNEGGGLYVAGMKELTIINQVISNNQGDALFVSSGQSENVVTLVNNTIINNLGNGLVVSTKQSKNTVSLFTNDISNNDGIGIYISTGQGAVDLTGNIVSDNSSDNINYNPDEFIGNPEEIKVKGGIYIENSAEVSIFNNIITGNIGHIGVSLPDNTSVYLYNNVIADNQNKSFRRVIENVGVGEAEGEKEEEKEVSGLPLWYGRGGGIYSNGEDVHLINNTITGNIAAGAGGGLYLGLKKYPSYADIYNNIIWGNFAATNATDLYLDNDGDSDYFRSAIYLFNNNFDQSETGVSIDPVLFLVHYNNMNNVNPLFGDDYVLREDSPCIDVGDNEPPSLPVGDILGNKRIFDGDSDGVGIIDLGAYEVGSIDASPDILVTPLIHDFGDVTIGVSSAPLTLTVSNIGNSDLEIKTVSIAGDDSAEFKFQNIVCASAIISPAASCRADLVFSPQSPGARTVNFEISSDDPDTPVLKVPLSAKGGL